VDEPDEIIPPPIYNDDDRPDSARQHKASISGKKMTGRPALPQDSSSSLPLPRKSSNFNLSSSDFFDSSSIDSSTTDAKRILTQVAEWLNEEKAKASRKKKPKRRPLERAPTGDGVDDSAQSESAPEREDSLDLGALESILAGYMKSSERSTPRLLPKSPNLLGRRGSLAKKFKKPSVPPQSSDTEFFGEDILVPNVEADLDNTKTLAYSGGAAEGEGNEKLKKKDQKHWNTFKRDILRLTHTLKLKGWRRISMDISPEIEVSRLSGT
jgi:choline kinase